MKEVTITSNNAGQKAEKFVKKYLPEAPLGYIYKAFRKKDVKANGHWIKKDYVLQEGDVLRIYVTDQQLEDFRKPRPAEKKPFPYPVLYEDENVLIVSKPKGLLVYGDKTGVRETLGNAVLDYLYLKGDYSPEEASFTPSPAHRLDRNTSGIVVYGKTDAGLKALTDLFKTRVGISKRYLALVLGDLEGEGEIDKPLKKDEISGRVSICSLAHGGKSALTKYKAIEHYGNYTLIECDLITGRTHQIRVHLASIGHPIVGDEKYGDFADCRKVRKLTGLENQFLHAYKISFGNLSGVLQPLSGKEFISPLPKEERQIIDKLTSNNLE